MKLSVSEQIICELHSMGAINEQTGLNGKEVTELVNNAKAPSRLAELRKAGYVKSSDRSTGAMRFWLTPAGETYAIELKHYASEPKQDQSTDANCDQANNASENKDLTDATIINDATSQANSDDDCFKYPIYKISKATGLVVKFTDLTVGMTVRQGVDEGDIVGVIGKVCEHFPAHNDDKVWGDWTPTKAETAESTKFDPVIVENVESFNRMVDISALNETLEKQATKSNHWLDQAQIAVNQPLDKRVQYLIESREEDQNFIQALVKQREQAEEALQKAQTELAKNSDDNCMNCTQDSCGSCDEAKPIPLPQYNPDDVAFNKSDTVFWYTVDGIKEVFETSSDAIHAAQELVKNRKIFATIHAVASKPHAIIKPVVTTELEYV